MFKILTTLATLFMGSGSMFGKGSGIDLKGIQASIFDELAVRTRKPVLLVLIGFCAIIFFCGGAFMAIIDATQQYDRTGRIFATSTLWTGIVLAAITLGAYVYIFMHEWPGLKKVHAQKKAQEKAQEERERAQQAPHRPSDVEGAIAALVMDIVESRRNKRESRFNEREQRRTEREARRAAREARRSGSFEQSESWKTDQDLSSQEPPRH
jgi:uncharacterized membrane protein YcjF (UPF0283 family)